MPPAYQRNGSGRGVTRPNPLAATVLWVAGFALIIGAWQGASTQSDFHRQTVFVNLAVVGLVLVAAGSVIHLFELRRLVAACLTAVMERRQPTDE